MNRDAVLEGPRQALPEDLPSIAELTDHVFMQDKMGVMGDLFPRLFHRDNAENLFIFSENGRVVSHAGMVERKARIGECELHVACLGAVSTYDEYRGRGLATQLVDAALDKARRDGVDVMLISGDRTLYRRIGAMPVGCDLRCFAGTHARNGLHNPRLRLRKANENDLAACAAAYNEKPARFVRPLLDWQDRIQSNAAAEGWHHLLIVEEDGVFRAYIAVNRAPERSFGDVAEFGGSPEAIAGALRSVSDTTGEQSLKITLQRHDEVLCDLLTRAGVAFVPVSVDGSWTIVNFTRLIERLYPWVRQQAGKKAAASLEGIERGKTCLVTMQDKTLILSRNEAAEMIFGGVSCPSPPPPFDAVFPMPTIAYGIGYV